jgi:hypothetical protein
MGEAMGGGPESDGESYGSLGDRYREKVYEARTLLDWAITERHRDIKEDEAVAIPATLIKTVADAEVRCAPATTPAGAPTAPITGADLAAIDGAMQRLSELTAPVTIETLRDSASVDGAVSWTQRFIFNLVIVAIVTMAAVVATETLLDYGNAHWTAAGSSGWRSYLILVLAQLEPFTYGALGAIVFLLREAKRRATERSFDRHRKADFITRFVLGIVAGGCAALLVQTVGAPPGNAPTDETVELSKAVVGFIGGYSTEFLFRVIKNLIAAIEPRINVETPRPPRSDQAGASKGVSDEALSQVFKDLAMQLKDATDPEERKRILETIQALRAPA